MKRLFILSITMLLILSCAGKKSIREGTFDPPLWLQKADRLIKNDEFEEARKLLFEVKNRDLSKKYAPLAQLKIAESFNEEKLPDLAIDEYRRFIRLYPDHPQISYAQYQIGMTYYNQIESPDRGAGVARKALEEFKTLLNLYPRNPYREVVELRMSKCRNMIAEYEFLVGRFYYKKNSYQAALGRFLELINDFPDYKKTPEVLYLIGLSYKELQRTDLSLQYLKRLVSDFPGSSFSEKAVDVIASIERFQKSQ